MGPEARATEWPSVEMGFMWTGGFGAPGVYTRGKSFCQTASVGWEYCVGGIQAEMVSRWHLKSELGGDR